MKLIIIGCTSNICKIRVFENLNRINDSIKSIICVSRDKMSQYQWSTYIKNIQIDTNQILNKMTYIQCDHTLENYINKVGDFVDENTFVYICLPSHCYKTILDFKNSIRKGNFILEKPLALSYSEFISLKPYLHSGIIMMDHFMYKRDVQSMISHVNNMLEPIKTITFRFLYTDDVESRLEYFDKTGFFIDMFQSHFLSILQCLIGDKIQSLTNGFIQAIRKQYIGYGGKNNESDTYFHVKIIDIDYDLTFEAGKAMSQKKKEIIINDKKFVINDYADEYSVFFKTISSTNHNLLKKQETYWKITDHVRKNFRSMESYVKYSFSGF